VHWAVQVVVVSETLGMETLPSAIFFAALTPEILPVITIAWVAIPSGVLSPDIRIPPATSTVPFTAIFVGKEPVADPSLLMVTMPALCPAPSKLTMEAL